MTQPSPEPLPAPPTELPAEPVPEPPIRVVSAEEGSRLAELQAQYETAKANADEAAAALKAITDGIKAELTVNPESTKINLAGSEDGKRVPLRLTWVERWTIDTARLKKEQAYIYAAYAKRSGSWQLSAVR